MLSYKFSDELIEATLIFGVLFLPGYLLQGAEFSYTYLFDLTYLAGYLISALPQILLLVFLIARRKRNSDYGFRRIKPTDIGPVLLALAALLVLGVLTSLAAPGEAQESVQPTVLVILLVAFTSIATGYREELFYRSMLFGAFRKEGISIRNSVIAASLIFSCGHIYQGLIAFLGTLVMALFLHWHFVRYRNIHVIACSHAAYNFFILMFRAFSSL